MVSKGDALIEIDPRPYRATLLQAQGTLRTRPERAGAGADGSDALSRGAGAQRHRRADGRRSGKTGAAGPGHGEERSGHGAITTSCSCDYCHITAPITGQVGLRLVDPGNVVQSNGTTTLAVITQLQPITVIFTLPEDSLGPGARATARQRQAERRRVGSQRRRRRSPAASCWRSTTRSTPPPARSRCGRHSTTRTTRCFPISSSIRACWSIPCRA